MTTRIISQMSALPVGQSSEDRPLLRLFPLCDLYLINRSTIVTLIMRSTVVRRLCYVMDDVLCYQFCYVSQKW